MGESLQTRGRSEPVAIRPCEGHNDFRSCVDLQVAVWNFDPLDVVSSHLFSVAAETGGQVLGAYVGERMIGFALAFSASRNGMLYLHSHMLAVLPEYQNHGVGRSLKMAQREDALVRGIDRMEWTFDPLQTLNAYFNVVKLGAIMRRYIPDFYGSSSSPLHANLPTDRLVAEWRLNSPRVAAALADQPMRVSPEVTIAVPRNMSELRGNRLAEGIEIQAKIRQSLQRSFADGFAVTGFSVDESEGRYLLERHHED